ALQARYPDVIQIIRGHYSLEKAHALRYAQPPDKTARVEIWKLEEKMTDVNIALTAYRDVAADRADQIVFVSNDTDLVPALEAIRDDFDGRIRIGTVMPIRKSVAQAKEGRKANVRLAEL